MGKYWSVDAVAKDVSTSQYGTIVSLAESPVQENLLYAGTDDGVIQVSTDAQTWTKIETFPDVPEHTYVADILPSRFDANVVYAAFDNRKRDDFKPYLLMSRDQGKTWTSVAGNLPENGTVHTVVEDPVRAELLFAGTEFGCFFTVDGGEKWVQLKAGIPDVAVRDMVIQEREHDLVLATFGRGFYIMDDFSPLRDVTGELLEKDAHIFPVKDALMFVQQRGRSNQGSSYYTADNPPFGATFTYFLKESPKTKQQQRHEEERKLFKEGEKIPQPTWDEQRLEELEEKPHLIFTIADEAGNPVRRMTTSARQGVQRITWDLRLSSPRPVRLRGDKFNPTADDSSGFLAMPGRYTISMHLYSGGELTQLAGPVEFTARVLDNTTLPAPDRAELVAFQNEMSEMARAIMGTESFAEELAQRAEYIKQALYQTPGTSEELMQRARKLARDVDDILYQINGPRARASSEEIPPRQASINSRLRSMMYAQWRSTSKVTGTQRDAFAILKEEFPPLRQQLQQLHDIDLKTIEREMEELGAPWTPGRLPDWKF
jgi:hypothetical protein